MEAQAKTLSVEQFLSSLKQVLQKRGVEYEEKFDITGIGKVTIHVSPDDEMQKDESDLEKTSENMTRDELIAAIWPKEKIKPLGVLKYDDPFGPAVPDEDWEFNN